MITRRPVNVARNKRTEWKVRMEHLSKAAYLTACHAQNLIGADNHVGTQATNKTVLDQTML